MERYSSLSLGEKTKRRQQGAGNFTFSRYADDFVVLCNGGKDNAERMREELYQFLKSKLRLELSREKTKITHINDGFIFLGFRIYRGQGGSGITTKIVIPDEAMDKVRGKIRIALSPTSHQDSVNTKITGLNRLIRGWCQYDQYTSKASTQFSKLENELFWEMAHWLGRKFKIAMSEVMQRFNQNGITSGKYRLLTPTEFPSLRYPQRFFKPNPYLTQERVLSRENLPVESYWSGYEARPGMADLLPLIRERDEGVCQNCGISVTASTAEIDHIRPVRRFKRPIDANTFDNLWTLCKDCHQEKTKADRQAESRVR
jgi:RNA-directed DNA polymerase